jgi:hypothetical protein
MKQALVLLAILFVAILAVVVGQRLSTEVMAVVVGVVCGVAASIPVSLGLLLVLGRLPGLRSGTQPTEPARRDMPPVVVVTPGRAQPAWPGLGYAGPSPWPMGQPGRERTFRTIPLGRLRPVVPVAKRTGRSRPVGSGIIGEADEGRLLHD